MDGTSEKITSDDASDSGGDGDEFNDTIRRPRPRAQVSFRLARHGQDDENDDDDNRKNNNKDRGNFRLAQSDPTAGGSAPAPRNRRRLFRDMSYTNRAVRRDSIAVPAKRRSIGNRELNDNGRTVKNNDGDADDNGHDGISGAFPSGPRRQESFRGIQRSGPAGRAGAPASARIRTYCEDRMQRASSFVVHGGGDDDDDDDRVPDRRYRNSSLTSSTEETYCIPPPEHGQNYSLLDTMSDFYSSQFADLAMWVHSASFGKCLLFFMALYMTIVYCFVVALYLVDRYYSNSRCINYISDGGGGGAPGGTFAHFEFAFELSWTTFTTVGYGQLGPPANTGCYPIRFLCSIEAILGMAFVSMCSGLFYAKLLKLLGGAPVTFSSTLCVQYGKGLEDGGVKKRLTTTTSPDRSSYNNERRAGRRRPQQSLSTTQEDVSYSFPVIEFRIVNNRANSMPGRNEIWDAEVTALLQLSIENDPRGHPDSGTDESRMRNALWQPPSFNDGDKNDERKKGEGQKVYCKLSLKPSFHPYFSRVWFLRHTLDATSPLLRREVRDHIKDRPQGWDPAFNNHQDIRDCLVEFNSIRVLMSGASALSRSEVYAEKIYTYEDLCVGWQYIAVCYEEKNSSHMKGAGCFGKKFTRRRRQSRKHIGFGDDMTTRVDLSLIHDILPQRGGDFEPVD